MQRRRLLSALGTATTLALAGCSGGESSESTTRVGMVYGIGGLGDNSFNDMAHSGVQRASEEFTVEFQNVEPTSDEEIATGQRQFARSTDPTYGLVCCIGTDQLPSIVQVAREFSDQKFALVDSVAETSGGGLVDNVANYVYREHEGSFLVGVLAGMLANREYSHAGGQSDGSGKIGFLGGKDIQVIRRFEDGYRAGAEHVVSDIEFQSQYAGAWADPAAGREIAAGMYDDGVDVIYHAAGATGNGLFEAAKSAGRFAIGVDNDQSRSFPEFSGVIVASMRKRVDRAVFRSIRSVVEGNFQGGTVTNLGLKEEGLDVVIGQDFEGALPQDVLDRIETTRQQIVSGEIDVLSRL